MAIKTDHEKFSNMCSGIQCIIVSAAVVVGGIWTLITFSALETVKKAKADLAALNRVSLARNIEVQQVPGTIKGQRGLIMNVKVENKGAKNINLDLSDEPVVVYKVVQKSNGELTADEKYVAKYFYSDLGKDEHKIFNQGIQVGCTVVLPFYLEVKNPGIYLVRFKSVIPESLVSEIDRQAVGVTSADTKEKAAATGNKYEEEVPWLATTVVSIK